jgi:ribosomal-protein-alanine N-acetyltransferase
MTHSLFPDLETDRLLLRGIAPQDADFIFRQFSDPDVTQYLMDEPPVKDRSEAQGIIDFFTAPGAAGNYHRWMVVRKSDGETMGTCGFHHWEKSYFRAEVGYDMQPAFWGQGYMREALRAILRVAFLNMELHRVDALIYVGNPRSILTVEKLGFKREGLLRDYFFLDNRYYDHYIYSLLKPEWENSISPACA